MNNSYLPQTYIVFYRPANLLKSDWTVIGNYFAQWLQQGRKPKYLHVGVCVGEGASAEYFSLCWDGLDFHYEKDIESKYIVERVPFYFNVDYLGVFASDCIRMGYKLLIMDLIKAFFRKRTCQYLCTGFVCDVIDRRNWLGTDKNGFLPVSPDQLYELVKNDELS